MNFLVELLFPRRCPVCDKPVDKMGRLICKSCKKKAGICAGTILYEVREKVEG